MNILFIINTPAQAYTWIPVIHELTSKGHRVKILARKYGNTVELLNLNDLPSYSFAPIYNRNLRMFEIFIHLQKGYDLVRKFGVDLVAGFGIDATFLAGIIRKPSIIFLDNDPSHFQNNLARMFQGAIITPDCFRADLGKKHVRVKGYKELIYLHPNYFKPDSSIFKELKINRDEKYVILRFNVFDAVHDIGARGFSIFDQHHLVEELSKYAHVFVSPEGNLSDDLEHYRLPVPYSRIHHVLYYAQLLVTDTQTMTTEAALLGTPVVRCNDFVGTNDCGNFIELEQKYNLIFNYRYKNAKQAMNKAVELIKLPHLKEQWIKKSQRLLEDKTDVRQSLANFIDNFPKSFRNFGS